MKHARPTVLLLAFAAFTLPLMPLQQLLLWLSPAAAARLPHWYHRNVARLLGIDIRISGARPDKGPAFIVANHVSWLDIIVLSAAAPVSFVAKREVGRNGPSSAPWPACSAPSLWTATAATPPAASVTRSASASRRAA
jgi:hypothetical protein